MSRVPSYSDPGDYPIEQDPLYNPQRTYGPGHPFCSPEHEAWEANRLRVQEWIRREVAARMKLSFR